MKRFNGESDFLEGPVLSKILIFSLPIFLGMVFQTFYNMVDSIVVGKYVSPDSRQGRRSLRRSFSARDRRRRSSRRSPRPSGSWLSSR